MFNLFTMPRLTVNQIALRFYRGCTFQMEPMVLESDAEEGSYADAVHKSYLPGRGPSISFSRNFGRHGSNEYDHPEYGKIIVSKPKIGLSGLYSTGTVDMARANYVVHAQLMDVISFIEANEDEIDLKMYAFAVADKIRRIKQAQERQAKIDADPGFANAKEIVTKIKKLVRANSIDVKLDLHHRGQDGKDDPYKIRVSRDFRIDGAVRVTFYHVTGWGNFPNMSMADVITRLSDSSFKHSTIEIKEGTNVVSLPLLGITLEKAA